MVDNTNAIIETFQEKEKKKEEKRLSYYYDIIVLVCYIIIYTTALFTFIFIFNRIWPIVQRLTPLKKYPKIPKLIVDAYTILNSMVLTPLYNVCVSIYSKVILVLLLGFIGLYIAYLIVKFIFPIRHTIVPGKIREPILDIFPLTLFKENEIFGFTDIFVDYLITRNKRFAKFVDNISEWSKTTIQQPLKGFGFEYEKKCRLVTTQEIIKKDGIVCPLGYLDRFNGECLKLVTRNVCDSDDDTEEKRSHRERLMDYVKSQNDRMKEQNENIKKLLSQK